MPTAILAQITLLFAVPSALTSLSYGHLSSTTIVLVYTLVPAATAFFAAQSTEQDLLRPLGPALAGAMGAALILPCALPSSAAGWLWLGAFLLSAVLSGFAILRLHALLAGQDTLPATTIAAFSVAAVALPLYVVQRPTLVLLTWQQALLSQTVHLVIDAVTLLLAVRLLRDLTPAAFSTRYFLVPLVTILEGFLILHPKANWPLAGGHPWLLGGGSALLLRGDEHQS